MNDLDHEPSQLPTNWRRLPSAQLEELLSEFTEPFITEADYDDVIEELDKREHESAELLGHHHDQLDDPHNERPFP